MDNLSKETPEPRYLSVKDTSKAYRWPIGGLRWIIFHAKYNGFESVIRRIGRKILIDRVAFEQWIDSLKSRGGL